MIHLLYGEDTLSLEEELARLRDVGMPDDLRDVNTNSMDGTTASMHDLEAAWSAPPFLADKRVVVVRGLLTRFESRRGRGGRGGGTSAIPPGWEGIGERLSQTPATTELIFADGAVGARNPLLRAMRSAAKTREFKLPASRDMPRWIAARAEMLGASLQPQAAAALSDAVGNDTRVADMELQKLALYRAGAAIRRQDVDAMVSYAREASIFAAVDAALEGRVGAALKSAHSLLDAGRPPVFIITMIARQARFLIVAKDLRARGLSRDEIGQRMRLSGYPLTKTMQQEGRFSAARLADIHRSLLEADLAIKTGASDDQTALDALIVLLATDGGGR